MNERPPFAALEKQVSRRKFLRTTGMLALAAAATGAGGWTYASAIEPHWWDIVPVTIALPRLPQEMAGFRLAQISDIHLSEAMPPEKLAEVCRAIIDLRPDMLALTGDYFDDLSYLRRWGDTMGSLLEQVTALIPAAAVFGNHDYRQGASTVRRLLETAGVRVLKNEAVPVTHAGQSFYLAGMDDIIRGAPDVQAVIAQIPEGAPAVLLAHEPDYVVKAARTRRFGLQLSGHSHGGQVNVPLLGPPVLPHLGRKYPAGWYQVGKRMQQYTNRGLGTTAPHVRLLCRPEITIITLQPGESAEG